LGTASLRVVLPAGGFSTPAVTKSQNRRFRNVTFCCQPRRPYRFSRKNWRRWAGVNWIENNPLLI
jgi:hypothetical protein